MILDDFFVGECVQNHDLLDTLDMLQCTLKDAIVCLKIFFVFI